MSSKGWNGVPRRTADAKIATDDPEAIEVEIWTYNPKLLAKGDVVDRFSLFLSLRDSKNERVEQALEQLMEAAEW